MPLFSLIVSFCSDKLRMSEQNRQVFQSAHLVCPLDGLTLDYARNDQQAAQMSCANGHSFDIARQGYINLLTVQDKRSKDPGDAKAMIAARSRILNAGLYRLIAESLADIVAESLKQKTAKTDAFKDVNQAQITLLDAGCGEGYYLDYLMGFIGQSCNVHGIGLDISKWAVMAASVRNKAITWLVASNRNPPVQSQSIDLIICGFGFPEFTAFKKTLKPNGLVIMLDPAENHLLELRKIIYPAIKQYKKPDFSRALDAGYSVMQQQRLTYHLADLDQQQIQDILTMSPHLYKATAEGKAAALAMASLDVTIDVNFTVLSI